MVGQKAGRSDEIVVVGGGILGCALAYDLAGLGMRVRLLERRELAREASWASAGIISAPVPSMATRAAMALHAYRRYPELVAEVEDLTRISTGFNITGELMVIGEDEHDEFRRIQQWQESNGIDVTWLEGDDLRKQEPALHERIGAGLFTPRTASVRLDKLCIALARAATLRGASIQEFSAVTSIQHNGGRATAVQTLDGRIDCGGVVIAAGAWSGSLLETLDINLPTHGVLGQMMAIANPPVRIRSIIAGGGGYIVPRSDGSVAVGATQEPESGMDARVTPAGVRWLIDLLDRVAPSLSQGTLESTWAGLRPATENGELVAGKVPHLDNVWVATGHFRSGALLGPATSQWLSQAIVDGTPSSHLSAFDPARFV
jgi:glycine oxidase